MFKAHIRIDSRHIFQASSVFLPVQIVPDCVQKIVVYCNQGADCELQCIRVHDSDVVKYPT